MNDRRTTYRGDVVGWGPTRARWYSICSGCRMRSEGRREDCPRCMAGSYRNDRAHAIGGWFHDHHYALWFRWVNRPHSKARRDLERWFPRLRPSGATDAKDED